LENIVAIHPTPPPTTSHGLNRGVLITVIVVSIAAAVLLSGAVLFLRVQIRRKRKTCAPGEEKHDDETPQEPTELQGQDVQPEMEGDDRDTRHEFPARMFVLRPEMMGSNRDLRHELDTREVPVELSAVVNEINE
jgi:hypothetical protein